MKWPLSSFLLLGMLLSAAGRRSTKSNDCEKMLVSHFSMKERRELCDTSPNSKGPGLCAIEAQAELGMSNYEEVLELCAGVSSALHIQCRMALPTRVRKQYGDDLCGQTPSLLPAECWKSLTSLPGSNKVDSSAAVDFCAELKTDASKAAVACVEAVAKSKILKSHQALESCSVALGDTDAISECVDYFGRLPRSPDMLSPTEAVQFCAESAAPSPAACFNATMEHPDLMYAQLSPHEMASLCQHAVVDSFGPSVCMAALHTSTKVRNQLTHAQGLALCQGAPSIGPVSCFKASEASRDVSLEDRLAICQGAISSGAAECFRGAQSVFRQEGQSTRAGGRDAKIDLRDLRKNLCMGAQSSAPADCVHSAPHYLANEERLQLCANTPAGRAAEPPHCLDDVALAYRRFKGADSMALGYFLANLLREEQRQSRALLINLCSFGGVHGTMEVGRRGMGSPKYASECLRLAPTSMILEDAVRMCTNAANAYNVKATGVHGTDAGGQGAGSGTATTAADDADYDEEQDDRQGAQPVTMCARMLPRDWTSAEVSALCGGANKATRHIAVTGAKVDAVVTCIKGIMGSAGSGRALGWGVKLSRDEGITMCRNEVSGAPVLTCARAAVSETSRKSQRIEPDLLLEVCAGAGAMQAQLQEDDLALVASRAETAGKCMGQLSADRYLRLDPGVASRVCFGDSPLAKVRCLQQMRLSGETVSLLDADACVSAERRVERAFAKFTRAENNSPHAVAGRWFAVQVSLFDQWGQPFDLAGVSIVAALDPKNRQGAVLWGLRTNTTNGAGIAELDRLVVSQSGLVELRLYTSTPTAAAVKLARKRGFPSVGSSSKQPERILIAAMQVLVRRDKDAVDPAPCMFAFHELETVARNSAEDDAQSLYPIVRGYLPALYYPRVLACTDVFKSWHVNVSSGASGDFILHYRSGIESIWTGTSFPSLDQSPEERLDLPGLSQRMAVLLEAEVAAEEATNTTTDGEDAEDAVPTKSIKVSAQAKKVAKSVGKELRKAYYRKSLMWHPDRWSGMPIYSEAVKGAFQLITDAYGQLSQLAAAASK